MEPESLSPPHFGSPGQSVRRLLEEMARLCALARVTEEVAVAILRSGFEQSNVSSVAYMSEDVDPFVASQVLSEWHENADFLAIDGAPARLSVVDGQFRKLCDAAAVKANPIELLELLIHAGAVRRTGDTVTATRRELIVGENHPAGVARAVRMLRDLASTLNHNLTRIVGEAGRFERSVANSKLPARQLPALLAYLSVHGQSFLEDLDSWMSARESESTFQTIGVGLYLFVESEPKLGSAAVKSKSLSPPQEP